MTNEQRLILETDLFTAISAFHDCDDKQKREQYVKEYTLDFCKQHGIDPLESIEALTKYFREKRKTSTISDYEHYKNRNLRRIILSGEDTEKEH